jgi:hypothetical protein
MAAPLPARWVQPGHFRARAIPRAIISPRTIDVNILMKNHQFFIAARLIRGKAAALHDPPRRCRMLRPAPAAPGHRRSRHIHL